MLATPTPYCEGAAQALPCSEVGRDVCHNTMSCIKQVHHVNVIMAGCATCMAYGMHCSMHGFMRAGGGGEGEGQQRHVDKPCGKQC